jgi:molybdenum cofactor cytidylyltransferase
MNNVEALVLAAGLGSRFAASGGGLKLGATLEGKALVRHVVEAALASNGVRVLVVTGHGAETVRATLAGLDVTFVSNEHYAEGLSTSLGKGLDVVDPETAGIVVLLGDMPRVDTKMIDRLIERFQTLDESRAAVVPVYEGVWGNPVLLSRRLFPALAALKGDRGARAVLEDALVDLMPVEDPAVLLDVDTPAALAALPLRDR